ncbi:CRAL/TRIO domain-containing protein [Gonapodya prolifera JEL478]|uniref:CRAL/TRIO domain-containing protein n=1 Tax=Gonapodya prolifera (strain JEL478) TaxID=1344416 RepID=A0A139ASJ2_GONPJ|nr:CRAL/TRIO domain-containing protein [Gonapodya prolifera JEL478]|eukprot:KXS19710.1 CRAL/TRIO domain-containing protein [Gonapodya prolifera JEL478]
MTANDPGHVNNLSKDQERSLRRFWARILSELSDKDGDLAGYSLADDDDGAPSAKAMRTSSSISATSNVSSGSRNGVGTTDPDEDESDDEFHDALEGPVFTEEDKAGIEKTKEFIDPGADATRDQMLQELYYSCGFDDADVMVLRFLRARKWDISKAYIMITNAIKWRLKSDVKGLLEKGESFIGFSSLEKGKGYYLPVTDKLGRPVVCVHVARHHKNDPLIETERFTIWEMETGRQILKYPAEAATIVFDMTDFGLKNMDYPFVKILISVLEAYYPECLGLLLIVNAPWVFNGVWKIIKPLIDPVVASKIRFAKISEVPTWIEKDALPTSLGGKFVYKFNKADTAELAKNAQRAADKAGRVAAEKAWKSAWEKLRLATREWIITGHALDTATASEKASRSQAYEAASKKRKDIADTVAKNFRGYLKYVYLPGLYNRNGMIPPPS